MLIEIYDPYDVVVVPFPFVEKGSSKRRPAIVLSAREHQQESGYCSLLMVTTGRQVNFASDLIMEDFFAAGLSHPSVMRQKIFTLDSRLIVRKIGHLESPDKERLREKVLWHLSLA